MNSRILTLALTLALTAAACGESHTPDMDGGVDITFDARFPDTGPDASAMNNVGEACRGDMDCVGGAGTCITELPGGYCSDLCVAAEDCPTGSACVMVDRGTSICLDECDPGSPDQCRPGYGCGTGIGVPVCIPGCEDDTDCDGGTSCDPNGGFAGEGACFTPGAGTGDACTGSDQCPSGGFCFSEERSGFPGGYCAGFGCDVDSNTGCLDDGVCLPGGRGGGLCFRACTAHTDCREGYDCQASLSVPGRSSCQPAFDPDNLGGVCSEGRGDCTGGFCLSEGQTGWPDSYCVAVGCDPEAAESGCPGSGVCIDAADGAGVCLDNCRSVSDCRTGYDCLPSNAEDPSSPLACVPGCDTDADCRRSAEGFVCNPGSGLCTAPFDGAALGEPCTGADECVGGRCVDEADDGWPAGTCAYPGCRLRGAGRMSTCPTDSVCVDDGGGDPDLGVCVEACAAGSTSCRPGYACQPIDPDVVDGDHGCQPACAADSCGGGRACNAETGRCE